MALLICCSSTAAATVEPSTTTTTTIPTTSSKVFLPGNSSNTFLVPYQLRSLVDSLLISLKCAAFLWTHTGRKIGFISVTLALIMLTGYEWVPNLKCEPFLFKSPMKDVEQAKIVCFDDDECLGVFDFGCGNGEGEIGFCQDVETDSRQNSGCVYMDGAYTHNAMSSRYGTHFRACLVA